MSKEVAVAQKRDASDVYDRQIRLWGKEAQDKMAKAKVLYINVTGVSSEILKNLVLAGIRATICDTRPFPAAVADTPSFLLPPSATATSSTNTKDDNNDNGAESSEEPATKKTKYETVGQALKPVVEDLNLLLGDCEIIHEPLSELLLSDRLKEYPIVIASRISPTDAASLAKIVTAAGNKFLAADCFGMYGGSMMDLGDHSFRPEVGKKLLDPKPLTPHFSLEDMLKVPLQDAVNRFHKQHPPPVWMKYRCILEYCHMTKEWPTADVADDFSKQIRAWILSTSPKLADHEILQEDALKALAKLALAEFAPICSVLGGILGNEVIKAISGKGEPANNTVLFDGETCKAWTFLVRPKEESK